MKLTKTRLPALILTWQIAILPQLPAAPVLNPANCHYYDAVPVLTNWHGAKALAEAQYHLGLPGHLVTITSQAENDFLVANFPTAVVDPADYWIGAFQPEGSPEPDGNFQWVTGEPFVYQKWLAGEPNDANGRENAVHFYRTEGQWNDRPSDVMNDGYIVEFETPPVRIYTAIELEFATRVGLRYQLQSSSDLMAWTDFGGPIEGTGSYFSLLVSMRHSAHRFFRAEPIDLACGLVAYYPLNGSADDASGNGQNGVASSVVYVPDRFGAGNSAARFQGTTKSYVLANPVSFPPGDISVTFWMRTAQTSTESEKVLISFAAPVHDNSFTVFFAPTLQIDVVTDANRISTPVAINDDAWRHVAITWKQSNGQFLLYIDGVVAFTSTRATGLSRASEGSLALGNDQDCVGGCFLEASQAFAGDIDDVRIYNRALFPSEIKALFDATE